MDCPSCISSRLSLCFGGLSHVSHHLEQVSSDLSHPTLPSTQLTLSLLAKFYLRLCLLSMLGKLFPQICIWLSFWFLQDCPLLLENFLKPFLKLCPSPMILHILIPYFPFLFKTNDIFFVWLYFLLIFFFN